MGSTAMRTGPPCAALTGLPCRPVATSTSRRLAWSRVRLSLYDPSYEVNRTAVASGRGSAAASRSGSATPDQVTPGHPPAGHALEVAHQRGLWQPGQLGHRPGPRPADQAADG